MAWTGATSHTFNFTFSFKTKNYSHCFRTVLSPPHPQPPQFTVIGGDVSTNACPPPDYTVVGLVPANPSDRAV